MWTCCFIGLINRFFTLQLILRFQKLLCFHKQAPARHLLTRRTQCQGINHRRNVDVMHENVQNHVNKNTTIINLFIIPCLSTQTLYLCSKSLFLIAYFMFCDQWNEMEGSGTGLLHGRNNTRIAFFVDVNTEAGMIT